MKVNVCNTILPGAGQVMLPIVVEILSKYLILTCVYLSFALINGGRLNEACNCKTPTQKHISSKELISPIVQHSLRAWELYRMKIPTDLMGFFIYLLKV
jgi:hypothetical protein